MYVCMYVDIQIDKPPRALHPYNRRFLTHPVQALRHPHPNSNPDPIPKPDPNPIPDWWFVNIHYYSIDGVDGVAHCK